MNIHFAVAVVANLISNTNLQPPPIPEFHNNMYWSPDSEAESSEIFPGPRLGECHPSFGAFPTDPKWIFENAFIAVSGNF